METQPANILLGDLTLRIDNAVKVLTMPSDARRKEKRQYLTEEFTLSVLHSLGHVGKGAQRLMEAGKLAPLQLLLKLICRTSMNGEGLFSPKPSQRTTSYADKQEVIFDHLRHETKRLSSSGRMGTLQELCKLLGREDQYLTSTHGLLCNSLWLNDLLTLLGKDYPTNQDFEDYLKKWPKKTYTSLCTKLYLQRGEFRAFVSDHDDLRSLLGSILHRILHPTKSERAVFAPYTRSMPENKHIWMDYKLKLKPNEGIAVLIGDISSFTGSFKNIWFVLSALIIMLEEKQFNETIIVSIRGELLEVNLVQCLRIYLYLASIVQVKDGTETFVSLGGMLGVSGIDTLAKTIFALFLQRVCDTLQNVRTVLRVAGDDFMILVIFKENRIEDLWHAVGQIQCNVRERIGHLKEFHVSIVKVGFDDILPYKFCKKQIRARLEYTTRGGKVLTLMSQWPLPMLGQLFDEPGQVWSELDTLSFIDSLKAIPWVPDRDYLKSVYFTAAVIRHRVARVTERLVNHYELAEPNTLEGYSVKALELIFKVTELRTHDGVVYRDTIEAKAQAVNPKLLRKVELHFDKTRQWITILSSEHLPLRPLADSPDIPRLLTTDDDGVQTLMGLLERIDNAREEMTTLQ